MPVGAIATKCALGKWNPDRKVIGRHLVRVRPRIVFGITKAVSGLFVIGAVLALSAHAAVNPAASHPVLFDETNNLVTISNDYVELLFNRASHRVVRLAADHTGRRAFGINLLSSDGIRFDDADAAVTGTTEVQLLEHKPEQVSLRLVWSTAPQRRQAMKLTLTLRAAEHGVSLRCEFPDSPGGVDVQSVRVALRQWFLLGLFDRGVVQYVAGQNKSFTSRDRLRLFYTMDRQNGSVAIEPTNKSGIAESMLVSGKGSNSGGIEMRPQASGSAGDGWTESSSLSLPKRPANFTGLQEQTIAFYIYANDLPYPAYLAENEIAGNDHARRDSAAYFTAVYGSAAGVLGSYSEPGSAYPTLATPDRPYGDAFDFFDPDAWSTVTALTYSGDPLLWSEARGILERSESAQLPDGQIPHHFESGAPTYLSIAKSSQTGPNIFWVIAASEYAAGSGDEAWLRAHYLHLKLATEWVLAKYDPAHRLLRAGGPLFIDVFRRSGYTLDTNVAALYLLDRMSEVAEFCGDVISAERYRKLRHTLYLGIRSELWSGDHFITQRNPDGSARDLVDYDGNFAALAFGVPDKPAGRQLLHRMDAGPHTHPAMRGTWVSERRYEKDACYGGNEGDSDVAMARIWWLDMAARVRLGDQNTFDRLLNTLESDLLRDVWMPERYDAAGLPAHNNYYHEYPDVLSIVLREMRYGIHVGVRQVTIHPFGPSNFELRLGNLQVAFSPDFVSIKVPGLTMRQFTVGRLVPQENYTISGGKTVSTNAEGTLHFRAPAGVPIHLRRNRRAAESALKPTR